MKTLTVAALALAISGPAFSKPPDCTAQEGWPASMAQSELTGKGLLDAKRVDFSKTTVTLISSQEIGKNLYRQVHLVRFSYRNGDVIRAITVSDASNVECSADTVDVYSVSSKLGTRSDDLGRPLRRN